MPLVHLFAIIESAKENTEMWWIRENWSYDHTFIKNLNNETLTAEYIKLFYDYLNFYQSQPTAHDDKGVSIDSTSIIQIAKICNQLNKELTSLRTIDCIHATDGANSRR